MGHILKEKPFEKSFRTFSKIMCLTGSFIYKKPSHTYISFNRKPQPESFMTNQEFNCYHCHHYSNLCPKHFVVQNSQVLTYPICTAPASSPHQLHLCLTPKTRDSL